jgi:hypothetical protein
MTTKSRADDRGTLGKRDYQDALRGNLEALIPCHLHFVKNSDLSRRSREFESRRLRQCLKRIQPRRFDAVWYYF